MHIHSNTTVINTYIVHDIVRIYCICTNLSFAIGELGICAKATLEHLEREDLILVEERTNAGGRHFFNIAVVKEINFDLQRERERERRGGVEREREVF